MRRHDFPPKKKSPFEDIYGSPEGGGGGPSSPLQDLYGGGETATATATAPAASPLADVYSAAPESEPGAASIAAGEEQNYQENIAKLKALLQNPGLKPEQKRRVESMIKRWEEPSIRGFAVGNRVTEPGRSGASNFARGAATGLINYGVLGASDLLAGGAQLLLPKSFEKIIHLPEFRERVADSQQIVKEFFDPQGYSGGAGTVAGAIGSGFLPTTPAARGGSIATAVFKPFEVLNSAGFKSLARISPAAAAIVAKGTAPGAAFLNRLAAQAVGSSAVDAVQIADVLTNDALTTEQKIRAVTLTALASGGAAAATSLRAIKPTAAEIAEIKKSAKVTTKDTSGPTPPEAPQPGADPKRAAEAAALAQKGVESGEQAKINKRLTRGARAEWEAQNVNKDWKKDLTEAQRTDIITKYRARYANTNISTAAAQPAPAPETPSATPAPAPPAPAPEVPTTPPATATVEAPAAPAGVQEPAAVTLGEGGAVSRAPEAPSPTQSVVESDPTQVKPAATPADAEINRLQEELARERELRNVAEREADVDPETGLANRRAWLRAIEGANKDPNVRVMVWDLLNLKAVNEKVSYAEGTAYIVDAARAIETAVRTHVGDPKQHPRVFRYGGDEFGSLLPASADAEAIVATARQILGSSSVEGYPLGFRSALGATVAEAEAALAAVKAGETHTKYRDLGPAKTATVEQVVPGVEIKKPLSEHTVEELDKLYSAIDKAHDVTKTITGEAYAQGILAISEAKRLLKTKGVKVESLEPTTSGPKPQKEKVKVDNATAKDAGYMPGEYKHADPRANEGYAFMDGELKPVDRTALEKIKTHYNAQIARYEEARERLAKIVKDQLSADEVDTVLGVKDNRGSSKGELSSLIERRIRESKAEIDRYTRQHARYNEANPSSQPPPRANPADVTGSAVVKTALPTPEAKLPTELRKVTDPNIFRRQFTARLDKMPLPELEAHRDDLSQRLIGMDKKTAKDSGYIERLAKVNETIARRASPPGSGVTLQAHPAVTGFAAGFSMGLVAPADDEQQRWQNALYFGAAGALGTAGVMRLLNRAKVESVPDYQKEIREHVKSVEDAPLEKRKGMYSWLLERYGNIARRDIGISAVTKVAGGAALPAGRNPGKLAEVFGFWRGLTDRWLFGDSVGIYDRDGNWVQFNAKTMQTIAGMVKGDLRTVGDLAAAKRELELRAQPEPRTTGLTLEAARKMYANTPEIYHQASEELTKFFRAMKDLSVMSGLISKESSAKMDEQTYYVAVRRLFGGEPGSSPGVLDPKGRKKRGVPGPENLFKGLKGGKRPYQNPAEAAIDLLPKHLRAAELNRLTTEFFDMLAAIPASDRALIGRRLSKAETPKIAGEDVKIQMLRDELARTGNHISETEARAMVNYLSDESLNITNDVVRFYRNGEMEAWRVSEPVAKAFRSLQPHELEAFMTGAGILTKPTNLARVGITANPVFVGYQAIRDMWQYHMNGTYGLEPNANPIAKVLQAPFSLVQSGAYSMRGWLEIMFRTGEYRNYQNVGSGGESVASQGLQVIRGSVRRNTDLLERIKEQPSKNQFDQIIKEVRTGSFREAYASILSPIADAGRVGAYLKERGRGADVIEAVYRAKKAGANFSNRGDALLIQALNRSTLFLNPAIQGLDASRHAFQKDPIGYMARGVLGITIPSMYLWAAYKDDEQIVQLRSTPLGKKFWFFRVNGEIMKVPKPIFDGQVFGASIESYLDAMEKKDPDAVRNWTEAMYNDAAVNLMPFIGVAPISLMTGKIVGLGSSLNPQRTEGIDVEYRANPNSTLIARSVSKVVAPVARKVDNQFTDNALSPIGIDFLIQNYLGGFGAEVTKALSTAINVSQGGGMPVADEMPFIRSAFGQYPNLSTAAIQEFYRHAERSEEAANTVKYLAKSSPKDLGTYIETRLPEIQLAEMYQKTRQQLGDTRKAIEDIRLAPREVMDDATKRELTRLLMDLMIKQATLVNSAARSINEAQEAAAAAAQ